MPRKKDGSYRNAEYSEKETNQERNSSQGNQNKEHVGSRPDHQQLHQQKKGKNNNWGIIAENPLISELNIPISRLVVADGGMKGGCNENSSNMQEGVTKEGNLSHDGHEKEIID